MNHPLLRQVLRRLLLAILVLVGVATLSFLLARTLPGDPARMLLGPRAGPAEVAQARSIYGLDQPLWRQYGRFWSRLVHLAEPSEPADKHLSCARPFGSVHIDLGYSYLYRKPVTALIAAKAPISLRLALAALFVQALLGLGVGIFSAYYRGSHWDRLATGATLIGVSTPLFVVGLTLQYVLAHKLGLLPQDGYGTTTAEQLASMVLPALTLGALGTALYARIARDEVSLALSQDYARAARARGASTWRVLTVHALRNALVPITTLMVLDFGALVGGAIVTEKLFRWPGMGSMAVAAMTNRDGPVIFGTVLFSAFLMIVASVAVDLLSLALDPQLRQRNSGAQDAP